MAPHLSQDWLDLHRQLGEALPERPGVSGRVQHVVTGTPEGAVSYGLVMVDGRYTNAELGVLDAPDVTFTITHDDAVAMARGELELHVGFMQGRIKAVGDMGAVMAMLPATQSPEHRAMVTDLAARTEL
jgi:hypothetical protein